MITACKDLMLKDFITCVCDNDYTVLGEGTGDEQAEAWRKIRTEYAQLTEDNTSIQLEALTVELIYWETEILVVTAAVEVLRTWRMPGLLQQLRDKGYDFEFSETDVEAYQKDLSRVLVRLKSIQTQQLNRQHEINQLRAEVEGGPVQRLDMLHNIVAFSQFLQHHVDENTTTVEKYVAIRNAYYKKLESLNTGKYE
jgi:hypothetical protein